MQLDHKIFNAKLLLIGEYTVITGGQALTMPLKQYGGKWVRDPANVKSHEGLTKLLGYLQIEKSVGNLFDLRRFIRDVNDGLAFDSDIPQGYGLGSSGALVAAFYDRYVNDVDSDLTSLKSTLAAVECAFHGASSGLDPLVCYLNKTIWINGPSAPIVIIDKEFNLEKFFLLDTEISRKTEPLVTLWKTKEKVNSDFRRCNVRLLDLCANSIASILNEDDENLSNFLKLISEKQFAHYREMIPESIVPFWQSESHFLKLCGAGGGGMMLGYGTLPDQSSLKQISL